MFAFSWGSKTEKAVYFEIKQVIIKDKVKQ